MDTSCPAPFIDLAGKLAETSGEIVRRYFRTPVAVDSKADQSPVTVADREAETAMRALIEAECPDHGIIGEEFGALRPTADYVWLLDPIDGTKSFITGKPLFGTLIALACRGEPILGIIDQPVLGERWLGVKGRATTLNGAPARVRSCAGLGEAMLYAASPHMFEGADADAFARLSQRVRHPLYGADCYAYGLLASGYTDLVVEASLEAHDYAAPAAIVEGAGGVVTDWRGAPLRLGSDGRVIAAGDEKIHAEALELLGG
ncbi:MAG: histidinol-phosphatase [Alphaproteobacteria bacterium]